MPYIMRRLIYMFILLILVSVVSYFIIELPPGDFLTMKLIALEDSGKEISLELAANLRKLYGLDLPIHQRYLKWVWKMLHGDFGMSFFLNAPVKDLVAQRLPLSILISTCALLFTYMIAIPIGIYSATHQYSIGDYAGTVIGFIGLATPNFLLALVLMFMSYKYFDFNVGGLFSAQFLTQPWSFAKLIDFLKHLPIPIIVIGTAGTAGTIRVMRACLMDELKKQYVITARAKGVGEKVLLFRYPVRVALNPMISTVGWILPALVSGEVITAIVLSLPTVGPLLYTALKSQDMYLAGSIVMFLSFLTIIGTFISDILLVIVDPRINFAKKG